MIEEKRKLIGAKIIYYRNLKGYNQQQMADIAGLSRQYLSRIEHGRCSCSLEVLYRIAEVLEIPAAELLNETDEARRKDGHDGY